MGEKKKFIRDSVYGDISLNKFEQKVLDMPQFQRLRRIKQLGLINLIYPGANHTRFEHSIGTMNLGSKLANELELSEDEISLMKLNLLESLLCFMMLDMVPFHMCLKEYCHFLMKN